MPPHPRITWGISSVGRAVASHATGQGFESPMLQIYNSLSLNDLGCLLFRTHPLNLGCGCSMVGSSPNIVEFEFSYHDVPTFNKHS